MSIVTAWLLSWCILLVSPVGRTMGAGMVEYARYGGCVEIRNESTRVVLGPTCGGRVPEYSLNGAYALYLDPQQNEWTWRSGKPPVDPYGGRFDIGPEKIVPSHPMLWLGPWQHEITGPLSAGPVSQKDEATGVQLIREFELDANSSKLACTQTIRNVSDETKHWCHWSRTLAQGGRIRLILPAGFSRFPNRYVMYEPGPLLNFATKDPNIRVRDGFLEILGTPRHPKLGLNSNAGWFCYLMQSDLMFVKQFPTYPERIYHEVAALTISIWYFKDLMCELEPVGPMETLAPGQSASFTETWWPLPYAFPRDRTRIDAGQSTDALRKQLAQNEGRQG